MTLTLTCNYQERYILEGSVVSLGGIQRQCLGHHSLNEKNMNLQKLHFFWRRQKGNFKHLILEDPLL